VLKLPYGFIPSLASPSLRFLASLPKFKNKTIYLLPFACHARSLASSPLAKKCLNLGTIGRYHNTFAGGPFFEF